MTPKGWADVPQNGERVLWHGAPDTAIDWKEARSPRSLAALGLACLGVFLLALVVRDDGAEPTGPRLEGILSSPPDLAIALLGAGLVWTALYHAGGRLVWAALVRRRTRYLLTDKAGYVARGLLWRRISRHPLGTAGDLVLEDGTPGTVWFARELRWKSSRKEDWLVLGSNRRRVTGLIWERAMMPVGFKQITDAVEDYRLIRDCHGTHDTTEAPP